MRQYEALRDVPIITVSAYAPDQYRDAALEAGSNEYVSTPFDPQTLEKLIKNYLSAK
jgi:CheY-like chemotaxis protein